MSRINVENIRHPDAASDSLQLSDTGNITAPGNLSVTGTSTFTDDLVVDTDTLFVDVSADRVGVNSSAPSQPLTVFGSGSSGGVDFVARFGNGAAVAADNAVALLLGDASDHRAEIRATTVDANNGTLSFHTLGAGTRQERLRIGTDGSLQLRNSTGIDFSQIQTNVAGMTSELLDSYEEGTFTPTLGGGSNTFTQTPTGIYTKIGRVVTCMMRCQWSARSGSNGVTVALPFAVNSTSTLRGAGSIGMLSGVSSFITDTSLVYFQVDPSASFGNLRFSNENSTWSAFTPSQMQAGGEFQLTITYQI